MVGIMAVFVGGLVGLVVWLARLSGAQAAHIKALKKEVQAYAKSQQIRERVHAMPDDVVRRRLQEHTR